MHNHESCFVSKIRVGYEHSPRRENCSLELEHDRIPGVAATVRAV